MKEKVSPEHDINLAKEIDLLTTELQSINNSIEHGVLTIRSVTDNYNDIEDLQIKLLLKDLYSKAKYKKCYAMATLFKGVFMQKRAFFVTSRDSLLKAIDIDPDNEFKAKSLNWRTFDLLLAKWGICRLWDATRTHASGYLLVNPKLRKFLNLSNDELMLQFNEIKHFCKNDWVTKSMIFSESGECRVNIEEHRTLILKKRSSVKRVNSTKNADYDKIVSSMFTDLLSLHQRGAKLETFRYMKDYINSIKNDADLDTFYISLEKFVDINADTPNNKIYTIIAEYLAGQASQLKFT